MKCFTSLVLLFVLFLSVSVRAADLKFVEVGPLSQFHEHGKYSIYEEKVTGYEKFGARKWIVDKNGNKSTELDSYQIYNNGTRIKLVSKLGFSFENIYYEKDKEYNFNEAIVTFLDAEAKLPKAMEWLKDNGYNTRDFKTVKFKYPDDPRYLENSGKTVFWSDNVRKEDGTSGGMWVCGLTYTTGGDTAIVTWGLCKWDNLVVVHEYVHMCGYGSEYHNTHVFECSKL